MLSKITEKGPQSSQEGEKQEAKKEKHYENYECLKTLRGHKHSVCSVFESRDGNQIISGWGDNFIRIWGEKKEEES